MSKLNQLSSLRVPAGGVRPLVVFGVLLAAVGALGPFDSHAEDVAGGAPPNEGATAIGGTPEAQLSKDRGTDVTTDLDKAAISSAAETAGQTSSGNPSTLDQYMANRSIAKFTGRPITLQLRNVEALDVFRLISEASGFNIVLSDEVKGTVTLSLVDVPWDQALDVVLHTLHLGAERNNNILRITTLTSLTQEKQEQLSAQRASEATAPKVTKVFPVSYASLTDLTSTLQKFLSGSATPDLIRGSSSPPVIQPDPRTNSLIVRDLPENIERIRKLIEVLDTQTPQVLVEAKIVEATEGFSKSIGGNLGIGGSTSAGVNQFGTSFSGGNPTEPLIGTPGIFSDGTSFSGKSAGGATLGGSLSPATLRFLPGVKRLNAILNMAESDNQLKILSSPRTVVINKQAANITQGTPVLVPGTTFVAGVGSVPTTSVVSANLGLDVTPTVTNDGGVLMDVKVTRDIPFSLNNGSAVANRSIKTQVLVDSGSTLVIGGIYTMSTTHSSSGFPFLRKIPILGAFFGSETEGTDRSELFIFITPRILNSKEAGLTG
jgi:type IV pilus assembly protein PilQ